MGLAKKVILRPGCVPSKFDNQEDQRKRVGDTSTLPVECRKRQKFGLNIKGEMQVTIPKTSNANQDQPGTSTKDGSVSTRYNYCIVPQCRNNSNKTPDKMFVSVPTDIKMRYNWIRLAGRNPYEFSTATKLSVCEDHFNVSKFVYFKAKHDNNTFLPMKE